MDKVERQMETTNAKRSQPIALINCVQEALNDEQETPDFRLDCHRETTGFTKLERGE
jgi:hypothetical protein